MNLEELSDKELHEAFQKAEIARKIEESPEWKILKEASNRIVDRAINEFAKNVKADDELRIIELQTIIRKYKYGLLAEVDLLKTESEFLFEEAKSRGFFERWKKS